MYRIWLGELCHLQAYTRLGRGNELTGWMYNHLAGLAEALDIPDQAFEYALKSLSCMTAYPPDSTAVAYQKLRVAQLGARTENPESARFRSEAMECLRLHWGDSPDQ